MSQEDLVVCGDKSLTLMLGSRNETRCCVLCCVSCVRDEKSVWFLLVTKIKTKSTRDGDVDAHSLDLPTVLVVLYNNTSVLIRDGS